MIAALTPVAFILSPSYLNFPVDVALGILFPIHSHIAINIIITDYVPIALQAVSKMGLLGVTTITTLGLLKLTFFGPGLTETIKGLWRAEKKK